MGLFNNNHKQETIAVITEYRFPVLPEITELAPFKRNDKVIQTLPSGRKVYATVSECVWDYTVYNPVTKSDGNWEVYIGFYPFGKDGKQIETEIWYSWTGANALKKVG